MKIPYLTTFISSILLYTIPYEIGGSILRWTLALITAALYVLSFREVFRVIPKESRSVVALWQTNALAVFHLVLIYISLTFNPIATLISGMILGILLYLFVDYRIKEILQY